MGNATPYANKNGLLAATTKQFLIIMKHTLHVCNNEEMRSLIQKLATNVPGSHTTEILEGTRRTVNTVYIEYKSVVTQESQSHSHISGSAYFSSVIDALSTASTLHTHDSSHCHS